MSNDSPTDPAADAKRARRREWLLRGTFEAVLILIGLLGAFALNEWQDGRAREARVEALLSAIRAELEANLELHAAASAYNVEVANRLYELGSQGVEYAPASAYPRGLLIGPQLTSSAWTAAQNDPALSELPVEKVLMLARIYEAQREYVDDADGLFDVLYAKLLEVDAGLFRVDQLGQPLRVGGVLRDYANRGGRLVGEYRAALEQL